MDTSFSLPTRRQNNVVVARAEWFFLLHNNPWVSLHSPEPVQTDQIRVDCVRLGDPGSSFCVSLPNIPRLGNQLHQHHHRNTRSGELSLPCCHILSRRIFLQNGFPSNSTEPLSADQIWRLQSPGRQCGLHEQIFKFSQHFGSRLHLAVCLGSRLPPSHR